MFPNVALLALVPSPLIVTSLRNTIFFASGTIASFALFFVPVNPKSIDG
jgi:hypothetical protein